MPDGDDATSGRGRAGAPDATEDPREPSESRLSTFRPGGSKAKCVRDPSGLSNRARFRVLSGALAQAVEEPPTTSRCRTSSTSRGDKRTLRCLSVVFLFICRMSKVDGKPQAGAGESPTDAVARCATGTGNGAPHRHDFRSRDVSSLGLKIAKGRVDATPDLVRVAARISINATAGMDMSRQIRDAPRRS